MINYTISSETGVLSGPWTVDFIQNKVWNHDIGWNTGSSFR